MDVCARELLTSFGLRSLARTEAGYRGRYAGSPEERDAAYHQGTAWGWLLGPFALAHLRVYQNAEEAMSFLEPMFRHIKAAGLGTASEIFDGDRAIHTERLHRASVDGRGNFAGVAHNHGRARKGKRNAQRDCRVGFTQEAKFCSRSWEDRVCVAQASSLWILVLARTNCHRLEACATTRPATFGNREICRSLRNIQTRKRAPDSRHMGMGRHTRMDTHMDKDSKAQAAGLVLPCAGGFD